MLASGGELKQKHAVPNMATFNRHQILIPPRRRRLSVPAVSCVCSPIDTV